MRMALKCDFKAKIIIIFLILKNLIQTELGY